MSEYEKQANDFASKYGVKLSVISQRYGQMWNDDKNRYIFKMRLKRNGRQYTFDFGQSIANGNKIPTMYEVLAAMQKYDCGDFEDFCRSCDYDMYENRKETERTYKACCKEYAAMERLFSDCMEELQEIW